MSKHVGFRRALSVFLTLVLLVTSIAVAGVSVSAAATEYHYTFDDSTDGFTYADYYRADGSNFNNCVMSGINTRMVSGGYNGSSMAMEMAYTANTSAQGNLHLASFSLPNNTGSTKNERLPGKTINLERGSTFRISVTYRVTSYVSSAGLYFTMGMGALSRDLFPFNNLYPTKIADITATSGWQTASIIVTPSVNTGAYLALKMDNNNNRAGTAVQVGAVDIVPVTASTVTFDTNGGGNIAPVSGESGSTIPYPADPVRDGYEFVGWFTPDNQAAPTVFPTGNLTLVAKWLDTRVWGFEDESVGDEFALTNTTGNAATVTTERAYNGTQSLKLTSADKTGVNRPQVTLRDMNGDVVTVQEGGFYDVSFYVMFPDASSVQHFYYWLTAADDDVAYTDSVTRNAEMLYEQNMVPLTGDGVWQRVTVSLNDIDYSGDLRLGIAGNVGGTHTFYIDDVKVEEKIYTAPEAGVWSFEQETAGSKVSIALIPDFNNTETIHVTNETYHSGWASARINATTNSGTYRAQMMVKDGSGNTVAIEQSKSYLVSFWLMVPQGEESYDINYWLAATPNDTAFNTTDYKKDDYALMETTVTPAALGEWQKVTAYVEAARLNGDLRIGLTRRTSGAFNSKFFVDDVKVEEIAASGSVVQSFENYATGTALDLNSDSGTTIVVSDAIAGITGTQTALVKSNNNTGNGRPQMMVKDGLDRQLRVYKGRSYEFSFHVYIPQDEADFKFSYWLAASENETMFSDTNKKNDYVIAEETAATQPTRGEWVKVTLTINNCPHSGKLRFGVSGHTYIAHSFYIDDLSLAEIKAEPVGDEDSFENYTLGQTVSLGDASVTVSDEDSHTGAQSAKVVTTGNAVDGAPQFTVNDAYLHPVTLEAGKGYTVSFYVAVPLAETDYAVQYWLAVTDGNEPFSATSPRTGVVVDTTTVQVAEKHVWQLVTANIPALTTGGKLRLGISGSTAAAHTFYIDDILVRERTLKAPDPDAMNFENLAVGEHINLHGNSASNTAVVTDVESYTGAQSVQIITNDRSGDSRPQFNVTDADGNLIRVKKGEDYYLTFMIYVPTTNWYATISYWAAAVPEDKADAPFVRGSSFLKNDYVIAEVTGGDLPTPGTWQQVKLAISDCAHDGILRVGITHTADSDVVDYMYVDDIKLEPPQYVLVKFETNGGEAMEDVLVLSDSTIPNDVAPYRQGYEFMGWYTDPACGKDSYFDISYDPVVGRTGDVLTLYAAWREWDGDFDLIIRGEEEKQYKTEYYTEKVWVGDQNVPDPFESGERPPRAEAEAIVVTPDEVVPEPDGGIPPWLIVTIIVAAVVVVGGGAVIAALLLKKSKKA